MMVKHTLEDQLILHEGLKLKTYRCPAGYWTIGVGRNLETKSLSRGEQQYIVGCDELTPRQVVNILKRRGITKEEALVLLAHDIQDCEQDLKQFDWFDRLDPVRKKVVIDMRFNLGPGGFRDFRKMIAALAAGDYKQAAEEMKDSKWYWEVGNRSRRLVKMMATGHDYDLKEKFDLTT
jgi:lysozyme